MAGSYSDVPGYRFAYDIDGTTGIRVNLGGGSPITLSGDDLTRMNRNAGDIYGGLYPGSNQWITLIFPEIRTIKGYFLSVRYYNPSVGRIISTSLDTTSGVDGTWSELVNPYTYSVIDNSNVAPFYRSNVQTTANTSAKAIRFSVDDYIGAFHVFGSIATTESPDRLRVVDTSNNDISAQLDFGNIPQRASVTKQFKVINNSATKTATDITVSLSTISDASPTIIGQFEVSTDNIGFANAVNIGDLAPGASSGTLYIRDSVASNAQLSVWSARIIAHPTGWI